MFPASRSITISSNVTLNLVRTLARVRYAYPRGYTPEVDPKTHKKKDHRTWFRRHLKAWLGPMNIRGEYYQNKYYYPPQEHKPNYIDQTGVTLVTGHQKKGGDDARVGGARGRFANDFSGNAQFQPFPENPACKTNLMISNELKEKIQEELTVNGLHPQQVAHKYGIKIPRVEAISKLQEIQKQWQEQNKITPELENFGKVMYKMFPLYEPPVNAENLTEIPTPSKTLHQRFLTISESEPFGPVDAAKLFDLEPAQQTLDNLTEIEEAGGDASKLSKVKKNKVLVGAQKKDDRTFFKFTHSKAGEVGHRYGAGIRDTKKDRRIGFNAEGKMVNM